MKKTLLLSAALLVSAGVFAQEGTDITPANYKVGTPGVELPFYPDGELAIKNVNFAVNGTSSNIWSQIDGDKYYDKGLVGLTSGGGLNIDQWNGAMKSWNYIDFGGEIGRVAAFITKDCNIADVLSDWAPNRSDEWDALNMDDQVFGGGALNFFLDPNNCPTDGWVRAQFILNIFNNDFSGNKFIQYFSPVGNEGNVNSVWDGNSYNQAEPTATALMNDVCMDENTGEWDPTSWAKVTIDFKMAGPDEDGKSYTPYRMKVFFMNQQAINNSALFIQNISFTYYTEGTPEYFGGKVEMITLSEGLADVTGGDEPGGEEPGDEEVALYLIGDNVNGSNWALGTNEMTYENGLYTWTGETLGSGFKINDGTWDNADYNFGAEDSKVPLVLGEAYPVVASATSGNINFDNGPIEKPTVVFDLKAMTVTVTTSAGVESLLDENAPVEYYNLQGVKVANPEKGMYILKQGNKTSKVVVR